MAVVLTKRTKGASSLAHRAEVEAMAFLGVCRIAMGARTIEWSYGLPADKLLSMKGRVSVSPRGRFIVCRQRGTHLTERGRGEVGVHMKVKGRKG